MDITLSLKEKPWGADYNLATDCLIVGTSGGLTFYPFQEGGAPRQQIWFDFKHPAALLKVQQTKKSLIATTAGSSILLWDPYQLVSPLRKVVEHHTLIEELLWQPEDDNLLITLSHDNVVSLWDIRTPHHAVSELLIERPCRRLQSCPGGNSHLLSVAVDDRFLVLWDTRKLSPSPSHENTGLQDGSYSVYETENEILDYCWHQHRSNRGNTTSCMGGCFDGGAISLHIINSNYTIESWSLDSSLLKKDDVEMTIKGMSPTLSEFHLTPPPINHLNQNLLLFGIDSTDKQHKLFNLQVQRAGKTVQAEKVTAWSDNIVTTFYRQTNGMGGSDEIFVFAEDGKVHTVQRTTFFVGDLEDNLKTFSTDSLAKKMITRDSLKPFYEIPEQRKYFNPRSHNLSTSTHELVGPRVFLQLMNEETTLLDRGIKEGQSATNKCLEGLRIEKKDEFCREIVLSLLLPGRDRTCHARKSFTSTFVNYYDGRELEAFYTSNPILTMNQTVALTISFPATLTGSWNPIFSIDNRSCTMLDETAVSRIIEELNSLVQTRPFPKIARNSYSTLTTSDSILCQLALCFRRRILRLWEKAMEPDSRSLGRSYNNSLEIAKSFLTESDCGKENAELKYLQYIDGQSYNVPFPILSGARFNSKGELVLFGCAQLVLSEGTFETKNSFVERMPPRLLSYHEGKQEEGQLRRPSLVLPGHHMSYAYLMCFNMAKRVSSDNMLSSSNGQEVSSLYSKRMQLLQEQVKGDVGFGSSQLSLPPHRESFNEEDSDEEQGDKEGKMRNCVAEGLNEEQKTGSALAHSDEDEDDDEEEEDEDDHHPHFAMDMDSESGPTEEQESETEQSEHEPDNEKDDDDDDEEEEECSEEDKESHEDEDDDDEDDEDEEEESESSKEKPLSSSSVVMISEDINDDHLPVLEVVHSYKPPLVPVCVPVIAMNSEMKTSQSALSMDSYYIGQDAGSIQNPTESLSAQSCLPSLEAKEEEAKDIEEKVTAQLTLLPSFFRKLNLLSELYSMGPSTTLTNAAEDHKARVQAAQHNAEMVARHLPDEQLLIRVWTLLAVALEVRSLTEDGDLINWTNSVLGYTMFNRLIGHLCDRGDLQTWAVVICVVGGSRSFLSLLQPETKVAILGRGEQLHSSETVYLDEAVLLFLDQKLYSYAQLLVQNSDFARGAEVFKHLELSYATQSRPCFDCAQMSQGQLGVEFYRLDGQYDAEEEGSSDGEILEFVFCSLCLQKVSGLCVCCKACGHGGHIDHLLEWFDRDERCPTGCGCRCSTTLQYEEVNFEEAEPLVSQEHSYYNLSSHGIDPMTNQEDSYVNLSSHGGGFINVKKPNNYNSSIFFGPYSNGSTDGDDSNSDRDTLEYRRSIPFK